MKRRILALLLALVLTVGLLPTAAWAEDLPGAPEAEEAQLIGDGDSQENAVPEENGDPEEGPVEEPGENPENGEPAQEPADEPENTPTEKSETLEEVSTAAPVEPEEVAKPVPVGTLAMDEDVTVYVSVAKDGSFVEGKDTSIIARVLISIAGENPTIDAAFRQLHASHCNEGENAYASTETGFITKFWGVETGDIGYYKNNAYVKTSTMEPVADGDELVFWFYQDTVEYSDQYTYFEGKTASVSGGEALTLTLRTTEGTMEGADITVDGSPLPGKQSGENGKVTLYFAKSGEYLVSANAPEGSYIVPPVCLVTVNGDDANAAADVSADKDALSIPETVNENLVLPLIGSSGKTSIVWSTSNAAVLTADGKVKKGAEEKTVSLTATLTYGEQTATKQFTITVPPLDDEDLIALAAEALKAEKLIPSQYNADFTAAGDTNIVTLAQQVVDKAVSGVTVAQTLTSDNTAIAASGGITYPSKDSTGNVTFTLKKGSAERAVTCTVTVPKSAMTRQAYMDGALKTYPGALLSNGKNESLDKIKDNLANMSNPSTVKTFVQIKWTIPSEGKDYLSEYGSVTRPAYEQSDVSFTLKGTATWYSMMEQWGMPSGCVGPTPDAKEIEIQLTILAITEEEYDAAKAEVDAALAAVNIASADYVSDFNDSTVPVNPDSVTCSALNLKSAAAYSTGITSVWTSSDESVIKAPAYKTGKAEVTRPAPREQAKSCTLTLTLSKNGYEAHKDFTFTVKPLSQDEINAEKAYLEKVKEALTFDVIRQDNTSAAEVTGNLHMSYRGIVDVESGEVTWKYSNSGSDGAKIEWATSNAAVIATYGTVTRQAADTQVTMTATISSQVLPAAQVPPVTAEIPVTVLGTNSLSKPQRIDTLLDNIAASYVNESSEWKVMDMGAYALYKPDASAKLSETARQTYINKAIASINKTTAVADTVYSKAILALTASGVDVTKLYPENSNTPINAITGLNGAEQKSSPWNAPYTLMSYNQADYAGTEQYEQALLQKVLAEQKEDGSWDSFGTIDTTANVLASLAFYSGDPDVASAIEKGIEYLAGQMGNDGTYNGGYGINSNSTAMVIVGLCANGVNPEADPRFVKNGVSVLDGLLSFALADNSGFGYTNNSAINAGSTEQGFRALIAAAQTLSSGKALNVYDFSKVTVSAAHATGTGAVTPPEASTGDNITVTVSIKADTGYWLSRKTVTIPGTGAKVYHAFMKALEGSGITQVGAENNYVSSMTYGEKTLAEFTKGPSSGWLYKVNGELPTVGLAKFAISDGDEIVFFYTEDYTKEEGSGNWSSGGTTTKPEDKTETTLNPEVEVNNKGEANAVIDENALSNTIADAKTDKADVIVIAPEVKGDASKVSVELPKSGVDNIAKQTNADLKVETGIVDITIPQESLNDLANQSGSKVTVSAEAVKDTDNVKIEIAVDGKSVDKLSGGIAVTVPAKDEKSGNVLVIVNSDGSETVVKKSIVNGKTVEAVLDGSCTVKVVDNSKHFDDTVNHWSRDAVAFASSHELFSGTSPNTFAPDTSMSRAMLATVLYRLEDAVATGSNAFADVPEGTWYTDAVTWASNAGIVTGTGSGFDPNGNVTREQLATMLYRYAKTLGMSTNASGDLSKFSDGNKTSSWAKDAMSWAVGSGLISGKGNSVLDPTGSATRAEVAVIMQRLIGLMVK